ncbi:alpha-amylase family protein [Pelagibacterium montanilacus]|uniref:alpha-amylase family protein n=1 Tax=Pelagibacterium montanilacus TaxID=2185280 RepID=UPI0013DF83CD|nr:alpha-amylase family protein [Pelagibacterium montanilacus]
MTTEPWYRTTLRWGQTNLVEVDPLRYDGQWWREHWKKTQIQGVIVNAGGIVAYYPSKYPLHHRAETLGSRDLYGEIVDAARQEGLTVIARMDSNRVSQDFFQAHPDWMAVNADGAPYRRADKYVTCINSPYYNDYLPRVMEEIIERSSPDGFADNSWAGLPRDSICYCDHCREGFRAHSGHDLPRAHDWNSAIYRDWIRWNFACRTRLWELNNAVTMKAGGDHCRWMGMISGDVIYNGQRFIDLQAILSRSEIVMLDHQRRNAIDGFEGNTEAGKRLHQLVGWDRHIPESTPQYQLGSPAFRLATMPEAEIRLWATSGFAGGIQPWWHHIGSCHEDRRQYQTAEPLFAWHKDNQDVLFNRVPVADVGIVWSQQNHDFHGRDQATDRTMASYRGAVKSMDRAGLTYLPVHADDIAALPESVKVLILPDMGALSDDHVAAIDAFARAGGSVIATSETGIRDAQGNTRDRLALEALFGVRREDAAHGGIGPADPSLEVCDRHSYLRFAQELRGGVYGPADPEASRTAGGRGPLFDGFDLTDTVPFGGHLPVFRTYEDVEVLATYVPPFPIFPPETSWMRDPRTDIPAITMRTTSAGGRLIWFIADLDRCFARDELPDHARLIANAVKWAIGGHPAVDLHGGNGLVSPTLYCQPGRSILHLNHRLTTSPIPGRQHTLVASGPLSVRIKAPDGKTAAAARLRVADTDVTPAMENGYAEVDIEAVTDHEVVVIDWH